MPTHTIRTRSTRPSEPPPIDRASIPSFLTDAAHIAGGSAAGVAFPRDEAETAALVAGAVHVLAVGAQSSLTGGATPRGELVLSTRGLTRLEIGRGRVRAGAGVPLVALQQALAATGQYYPPVPTFEGATLGGTIATNAAGAATFKYGSTRHWVERLTVVLASGELLDLERGSVTASAEGRFECHTRGGILTVPVPALRMPDVPKLSAGYHAHPGMDLIDLFIGSEGTLGVIIEATLRVVPRPRRSVALVRCDDDAQALALTAVLRDEARLAWRGAGPLDVSAIEYMDAAALRCAGPEAFARAGIPAPDNGSVLLLVQLEVPDDEAPALERLQTVIETCAIAADPVLAAPGDERSAQRLFELREAVPTGVNARVARAKARIDPGIEKTAGDMIVPFERLGESLALYRTVGAAHRLDVAIWGHVSDGNLHPNVIPASLEDVRRGREAILDMGRGVIALGGAPLAEHGVGRSALKQALLRELYGDKGIEGMRAVKRALDPDGKLAPGVLFGMAP